MNRYFDDFAPMRWLKRINFGLQFLLLLTFILGINVLAFRHYVRLDKTQDHRYSLSPETLAYLRQLIKPIKIIVTIPQTTANDQLKRFHEDISRLLREYQYATRENGENKITVEYVNIFQQRKRAQELAQKYDIQHENSILMLCEDRFKKILALDLYDSKSQNFKGEEAFTGALLDVTQPQRKKIYFLQGHGEMSPDNADPIKGLSVMKSFLLQRNFELAGLDLMRVSGVPEDANLLILPGPATPLLSEECEKLKRYLSEKNGRLMLFLAPFKSHGLEDLFYDWGILCENRVIFDVSDDQSSSGDLIIRRLTAHPITQLLIDGQITLLVGLTRPVIPDMGAPQDERRMVKPLLYTSNKSWAKATREHELDVHYDPETDIIGPLCVAILSERSIPSPLTGTKSSGGRLLVFGNVDFIANNRFSILGNSIFFNNAIQWMIDREDCLHIPPRLVKECQLAISRRDIFIVGFNFLFVPLAIALLGALVLIKRRY